MTFRPLFALALAATMPVASASPKYSAPISITRDTTLRATLTGTLPSPITETMYRAAGDIDGDGVADTGTLRVACRGKEIAFASFLPRDVITRDLSSVSKSSETNLMLSRSSSWDVLILSRGVNVTFAVQSHPSEGKTMSADSWHVARITDAAAAAVCP